MKDLTATNLKSALWDTLVDLQAGNKQPAEGDAIAVQAREIIRTVNTQLRIAQQTKRNVPTMNKKYALDPLYAVSTTSDGSCDCVIDDKLFYAVKKQIQFNHSSGMLACDLEHYTEIHALHNTSHVHETIDAIEFELHEGSPRDVTYFL